MQSFIDCRGGKNSKCGDGGDGEKQWKCGGGGGGGEGGKRWKWVVVVVEENNRNVAVVVEEENHRILWPSKLYQCATCYHFLSLHSAPEELT